MKLKCEEGMTDTQCAKRERIAVWVNNKYARMHRDFTFIMGGDVGFLFSNPIVILRFITGSEELIAALERWQANDDVILGGRNGGESATLNTAKRIFLPSIAKEIERTSTLIIDDPKRPPMPLVDIGIYTLDEPVDYAGGRLMKDIHMTPYKRVEDYQRGQRMALKREMRAKNPDMDEKYIDKQVKREFPSPKQMWTMMGQKTVDGITNPLYIENENSRVIVWQDWLDDRYFEITGDEAD